LEFPPGWNCRFPAAAFDQVHISQFFLTNPVLSEIVALHPQCGVAQQGLCRSLLPSGDQKQTGKARVCGCVG